MGRESDANTANQIASHLAAARQDTSLVDRWGRPIVPGGIYEFHPAMALPFTVVSIEPVRDLAAPAGLREVKLTCEVTLRQPNGSQMPRLSLISIPMPKEDGQANLPVPPDPNLPVPPDLPSLITES